MTDKKILTEIPPDNSRMVESLSPEDKVVIVFQGTPKIHYFGPGPGNDRILDDARNRAIEIAQRTDSCATYMIVPRECLHLGMTAVQRGVVVYALQEAVEMSSQDEDD